MWWPFKLVSGVRKVGLVRVERFAFMLGIWRWLTFERESESNWAWLRERRGVKKIPWRDVGVFEGAKRFWTSVC
jgi:hypothetical protein